MGYYDIIAEGYNELYLEEQINKLDIIKRHIKINKGTRILDVGCGTGISSGFDCFVVGIDSSKYLLKQNKNNKKIFGTAGNLPFKNNSFEYVISVTSLHNFEDISKSINEMKRVGNSYFVLSIFKKSKKFSFIKKLIEENFDINNIVDEGNDVIFFCMKSKNA